MKSKLYSQLSDWIKLYMMSLLSWETQSRKIQVSIIVVRAKFFKKNMIKNPMNLWKKL